jgi:ribonuclease D
MTDGDTPIRDPVSLQQHVGSWPPGAALALDTEFVRERTYYPRLCLIQAATGGQIVLIDVLAIADGGALSPVLTDPGRPKILHAARQDIEALLPLTGAPLAPVFDTQQAAALLGFPAQIGYAELVRQLLGVELAKGHARTDWSRRPLSREQLAYAADDVRYLPAIAAALGERLSAAGRRAWFDEESAALRDIALYRVEPAEAWRRLKGLERLDNAAFSAARALAAWRERRAMARNLPRGWVLPDAAIHQLAQSRPRAGSCRTPMPYRRAWLRARPSFDRRDFAAAPDDLPLRDAVGRAARCLSCGWRSVAGLAAIAGELDIQPEILATRRELAALARGARDLSVLAGWRRGVVGERLLAVL